MAYEGIRRTTRDLLATFSLGYADDIGKYLTYRWGCTLCAIRRTN